MKPSKVRKVIPGDQAGLFLSMNGKAGNTTIALGNKYGQDAGRGVIINESPEP